MTATPITQPPGWPICMSFQLLAACTWRDLWDAHALHFSLGEESLTDYNLLDLRRWNPNEIWVNKFATQAEHPIGADWEWWFGGAQGWFGMRVQAKRLTIGNLTYAVANLGQADDLIDAANYSGLYPAFCFYNSLPSAEVPAWHCSCIPRNNPLLGCTIADAYGVRRVLRRNDHRFRSMQNYASPWHCLVCCCHPDAGVTLAESAKHTARRLRGPKLRGRQPKPIPPLRREAPAYVMSVIGGQVLEIVGLRIAGILVFQTPER